MKIGFIGCGNMGGAILRGISKSISNVEKINIYDLSKEKVEGFKDIKNISIEDSEVDVVKNSDYIFLGVKPIYIGGVLEKIKSQVTSEKTLISMAAGVTLKDIYEIVGKETTLVRIMPNTPALIGEGITSLTYGDNFPSERKKVVEALLASFGLYEEIDENSIHGFIGLCGSSPAYIFMLIEAMADAGVLYGIPRDKAYALVTQSIIGSGKLLQETGKHPGELKDMVCSPGGTTIEAVAAFEEFGFRNAIIKSISRCIEKSKEMSNSK